MKAEDLENFKGETTHILTNSESTIIADVQFQIQLNSITPGPIPKEVATKKNFETHDAYTLEWSPKNGVYQRVL